MDEKLFSNLSNQSKPLCQKQHLNLTRTYTTNLKESIIPLVIKHNPRQSSSKIINKKSSKKFMPKYLYNSPYAVEKQKLLDEIEKQNMKLRQQNLIKKTLEKKLQKKIITTENKTQSFKKFNKSHTQSFQGIQRTITSSLQKNFVVQPNRNYFESIKSQIQLLTSQINKNQEAIIKIKQSKKYTRYMENEEQKNTFISEFNNMKKYKKKLKLEINRLKRIHQEKKNIKIKELIMEGQIQNKVQMQNIQIYNMIQDLKNNLNSIKLKKATLLNKKKTLIQQIGQLKERNNITDDIIEANFKPNRQIMSMTSKGLAYYRSVNSTQYQSVSNQLNDLGSLREEDQEEDQSMENSKYQKVRISGLKLNHSQDLVRENAVCTIKVHSNINSEDGNFKGAQSNNSIGQQKCLKQQQERQVMEKLDQKYFYEDENFESDDQMSGKDYDFEQYDKEESFESEQFDKEVQYQIEKQTSKQKTQGELPQKKIQNPREKQWNNRQARGISV